MMEDIFSYDSKDDAGKLVFSVSLYTDDSGILQVNIGNRGDNVTLDAKILDDLISTLLLASAYRDENLASC